MSPDQFISQLGTQHCNSNRRPWIPDCPVNPGIKSGEGNDNNTPTYSNATRSL
jgi:hypothetical protein